MEVNIRRSPDDGINESYQEKKTLVSKEWLQKQRNSLIENFCQTQPRRSVQQILKHKSDGVTE